MAVGSNVLGEAFVRIRAQFDKFDEDVAGAKNKLGGGLEKLGGALSGAVKGGLLAVGAAAAGATIAVGKFASDSTQAFIGFQQQMNEVFTLLPGITQESMDQMSDEVLAFSAKFGVLPEKTIPALYQAISAGVPANNVFAFLETAQKAAKGGVTDLETAVDGISSVVNAYGADVIGAAEASDLMFTAVRLGKTNMEELSQSLFNVIPTAASLGVGFEQITAAMAMMTAQGTPTSVATTQLRQLLVELGKGGTTAGDLLRKLGLQDFQTLTEQGKDLSWILNQIEFAANASGLELRDVFGSVEAANAALAISGDKMDQYQMTLETMTESAGATDKAFETMNGGLQASVERLNAFWATTKVGVGEALSPLIEKLADLAEESLPWLQEMFKQAQPIIAAFAEEFGSKLKPAAMIILDAFNRIGQALGITNEEFGGMDLVLSLLKISLDLLVTGLETTAVTLSLVADAVEWVATKVKEGIAGWQKFSDALDQLELPDWLTPGSPTPLELGVRGLTNALNQLPDFSGKFGGGLSGPSFAGLGAGGGAGGGGTTTIVNVDGVSAMSTGGDSVDEAIRLTVQLLRNQLSSRR